MRKHTLIIALIDFESLVVMSTYFDTREWLRYIAGQFTSGVMKAIKTAIDPNNIMNPGKIWY